MTIGRRWRWRAAILAAAAVVAIGAARRHDLLAKKVVVVEPGRLVRGAWQRPWPLRRIIDRERIRTIVTLTAINPWDPKYVDQRRVVEATGVDWVLVPMRGSTATVEQMAEAADLLADPDRQPVFFHCVAGHNRTNLTHAAYLIRHRGLTADQAWSVLARLPWTDPATDADDRRRIEEFADYCRLHPKDEGTPDEPSTEATAGGARRPAGDRPGDGLAGRLALGDGQRRHGRPR